MMLRYSEYFIMGRPIPRAGLVSKQSPVQKKMWGPSVIYEYRPTEFIRHAQ